MDQSEDTKRHAMREYFEGKKRLLPIVLIVIGVLSLFIIIGVVFIAIGLYLLFRHRKLIADSQIDQWTQEDYNAHDFLARAKLLTGIDAPVRDPVILYGLADSAMGSGIIEGSRMGDDGKFRSTPLGATVILCTANQLGIYQAGLDLTTGNRVNERILEVFYQDVVAIGYAISTESLDTKNYVQGIRTIPLSTEQVRRGITRGKLIENLRKLTERFRADIVADILQRDMRKTYRIDFVDGDHVQIPIADGRVTRQANAERDPEAGNASAQAMLALRSFVRDKKSAIMKGGEPGTGGPLY
jgi:hypothetical protein